MIEMTFDAPSLDSQKLLSNTDKSDQEEEIKTSQEYQELATENEQLKREKEALSKENLLLKNESKQIKKIQDNLYSKYTSQNNYYTPSSPTSKYDYKYTPSSQISKYSGRYNTNTLNRSSPNRTSTASKIYSDNNEYTTFSTDSSLKDINKYDSLKDIHKSPYGSNFSSNNSNSPSRKYTHGIENNNDDAYDNKIRFSSRSNKSAKKLFSNADESDQEEEIKTSRKYRELSNENEQLKREKETLSKENLLLKKESKQIKNVRDIIYKNGYTNTRDDSTKVEEIIESILNDKNSSDERIKQQTQEIKKLQRINEQNENVLRNIQEKLYQQANLDPTKTSLSSDELIDYIISEHTKYTRMITKKYIDLKKKVEITPAQPTNNLKEYIIQKMRIKKGLENKTETELIDTIINEHKTYRNFLRGVKNHLIEKGQIQPENQNKSINQLFDDIYSKKEEEIQTLINENRKLKETLKIEKERLDQEISSLSTENERLDQEISSLSTENEQLHNENELLRKEKETHHFKQLETKTKPETNESQTNLTEQIQQIQNMLISLQETKANTQPQNEDIKNENRELRAQNSKCQQKIEDLENTISELKAQLKNQRDNEMKESIEELKAVTSQLNKGKKLQTSNEDDEEDEEIDHYNYGTNENMKDKIKLLKKQIKGKENSIATLRNEKENLENKLFDNLEKENKGQEKTISSLSNIKAQFDELVSILEIDAIQENNYSIVLEKVQEIIDKNNQNDDYNQNNKLKEENEKLSNKIQKKEKEISSLNNIKTQFDELVSILEIDAIQENNYSIVYEKVQEIINKNNQNDDYNQNKLKEENEKLSNEIQKKEKEISSLNNIKAQLHKLIEILKIDEIQDDNYSIVLEKVQEITSKTNNNQLNVNQNDNNNEIEELKYKILKLQNDNQNLLHQKELIERQKDSSNDMLRRHITFIQTENDKQLKRIKYIQQQEIKIILGGEEEEEEEKNNDDNDKSDDSDDSDQNDLLSE